ncbi:MAG: hypothetical protein K6E21_01115 [Bacilli bacterium]|nr:hypothetical protein [Bacilli bacterium]
MKIKLKILNVFYLLFSVVAVAAYVLNMNSFMRASFNYKINKEALIEEAVDDRAFEELGISGEDLFSDLETIVFEVDVNVSYKDLLTAWTETGPDYSYYRGSRYDAVERYAMSYILAPAIDNVNDELSENLQRVAIAAVGKMIEKQAVNYMQVYCNGVNGSYDIFSSMEKNPNNVGTDRYDETRFNATLKSVSNSAFLLSDKTIFFDGQKNNGETIVVGLKENLYPFFEAIKKPASDYEQNLLTENFNAMNVNIEKCLDNLGFFDNQGRITPIEESIGVLLERLVNHQNYEDEGYDDDYYDSKFVDKFFAPLKAYIDEDGGEFENTLTELLINVIKASNANGSNNRLFTLIVIGARAFGILLILFLLSWVIKFITCFISFFRQKPFVRINPLFIITGTIEALLAILTLGSVIIYNYYDMNAIKQTIPIVKAIVPLGLSFQFIFAAWIPGVVAIINLLFSILYGPVKKKFKQDYRDEILYGTDFNDYE